MFIRILPAFILCIIAFISLSAWLNEGKNKNQAAKKAKNNLEITYENQTKNNQGQLDGKESQETQTSTEENASHRFQRFFPKVEVISNQQLWQAVKDLGYQKHHVFAAYLIANDAGKSKYLEILESNEHDEFFLEAYLKENQKISRSQMQSLMEDFSKNTNLFIRNIEMNIEEQNIDEAVKQLKLLNQTRSFDIAKPVRLAISDIYTSAHLPDNAAELLAGIAILEYNISNYESIAGKIKPWDLLDTKVLNEDKFAQALSKKSTEDRAQILEAYAKYAAKTGHLIGKMIANAMLQDKVLLETGKLVDSEHPLEKKAECLYGLSKQVTSPEHLSHDELLKYLKTFALKGEYQAMLEQREVNKSLKGACRKLLMTL